jgi:Flp pilus assembly protein TadG
MIRDRLVQRLPRRLAGASAVEFALIFPVVFAIVYGGIAYGYVYFLQQRINFIAQEAVRAAIAVAPGDDSDAYLAQAQAAANVAITNNFTAAGVAVPAALSVSFSLAGDVAEGDTLIVLVTYDLTNPTLFPTLSLPLVGAIPPLPPALQATAAGRLS